MKIFLAQQNYIIGDITYNTNKIITAIRHAKSLGGELIVFSELSICGYPPRDFLEFESFLQECMTAVEKIANEADGIAVLVGGPSKNPKKEGKDLLNTAFFLVDKQVQHTVHKTLLPNYDIFDEYRYFEPAVDWNIVEYKGIRLAITICEDLWDMEADTMYPFKPMDKLMSQNPDLMINLSASPFDYTHIEDRYWMVRENCKAYQLPLLYCNTVGSQTEIVFDGGSLIADSEGNILQEGKYFEEDLLEVIFLEGSLSGEVLKPEAILPKQSFTPINLDASIHIDRIYDALVIGIKEYFEKMGFQKAIVANSGGVDSALTIALASAALGAENVFTVLMPSQFSSDHSVVDGEQLCKNLGNPYEIIPIKDIYEAFESSLSGLFQDLPFNVAEENIQARTRGNLVMAIANKFNYILLNTSNKSELAVGYGTLYGDMAGGLAVLGDVYKTQVYELCKFINKEKEIIPLNILNKPPSAELRPGQKDSDSLPDYEVLDTLIYQYIELRKGPKELTDMGFEVSLVDKVLKMVNRNEYKRNQFCPIIRVSAKSFGPGRRMPIVGKYLS